MNTKQLTYGTLSHYICPFISHEDPYLSWEWNSELNVLCWIKGSSFCHCSRPRNVQPGQIIRVTFVHLAVPPSYSPHKHWTSLTCPSAVNNSDQAINSCLLAGIMVSVFVPCISDGNRVQTQIYFFVLHLCHITTPASFSV